MKAHVWRRVFLSMTILLVTAVPSFARGKKTASTEPGTYKEWGPDIDQIEIVKKFHMADYKSIVVEPVKTADVKMPDKDDNAYQPVVNVLTAATDTLVSGINRNSDVPQHASISEKARKAPATLVIRAKILEINPGSRAARYFAGFGAGAAGAKLEGEVVDGSTGEVLAKFTQERRSGTGSAGGGYEELLNRDLRAIGEDIARMLKEF